MAIFISFKRSIELLSSWRLKKRVILDQNQISTYCPFFDIKIQADPEFENRIFILTSQVHTHTLLWAALQRTPIIEPIMTSFLLGEINLGSL